MTENVPPVPPAPEHPYANWPQPGQGSYPSQGPYGPPQPYTPPGYGQQPPQYAPYPPQQYPPAAYWPQASPLKPKTSGYRVASGIVGIVLGVWLFIPSIAGFSNGSSTAFMAFLVLVAALGNITAGIVLLANQRNRNQGPPVTSLSFAGFALLLGLIGLAVTYFGAALFVSSLLLATPVLIVMSLGLAKEMRTA
ncbi:hypothetical protein ACFVTM_17210 [Arthrobacter sp. NPDC058130]|uniref:hypothetical protein n=1 Tax=Arthrobacter sp. NPDC058130 TaxID=3346353 RepID=UPI0036E4E832